MNAITTMHPEDIKAGLRKRFGTIRDFERARQLPRNSVSDLLRGKASARVAQAIEDELTIANPEAPPSDLSDSSGKGGDTHRLISVGR